MEQAAKPTDAKVVIDATVSLDGTWLKRRSHSSLHGVATICSTTDLTKVLNFKCPSRHYTTCSGLLGIKSHDQGAYEQLMTEHLTSGCDANHKGSSAGMEAAG